MESPIEPPRPSREAMLEKIRDAVNGIYKAEFGQLHQTHVTKCVAQYLGLISTRAKLYPDEQTKKIEELYDIIVSADATFARLPDDLKYGLSVKSPAGPAADRGKRIIRGGNSFS